MCKRCSRYVDLKDYRINSAVSKNFKTKGSFIIEPKGYVFNTEAIVREAVIKGRFLGKLTVDQLTIYSTAEIAGELVNDLHVDGTAVVKATARLFGTLEARNLVVEDGAVVVGSLCVAPKPEV